MNKIILNKMIIGWFTCCRYRLIVFFWNIRPIPITDSKFGLTNKKISLIHSKIRAFNQFKNWLSPNFNRLLHSYSWCSWNYSDFLPLFVLISFMITFYCVAENVISFYCRLPIFYFLAGAHLIISEHLLFLRYSVLAVTESLSSRLTILL